MNGGLEARVVRVLPAVRESPAFQLNLQLFCAPGITVIMGPSGSGKTLLLNCLAGFARPNEGRILLDGELHFDAATGVNIPPERRRCAYIFQDHALFPHMTVRQNLRFAAASSSSRSGRLHAHRRIQELLEIFDLTALADRRPLQLSGGQKQRAALARILVTDPHLVLLDEPSRGLDARLRRSFWDLLRSLRDRLPLPILLVSHDMEECCELSDFVAVLETGELLQHGFRQDVLQKPASLRVAHLLGLYNVAPAEIRGLDRARNLSRLGVLGQEIEGPYLPGHLIGDRGFACVRQSELRAVLNGSEPSDNRLTLRIEGRQPSPSGVRVSLEGGFSVILTEQENSFLQNAPELTLLVEAAAVGFLEK